MRPLIASIGLLLVSLVGCQSDPQQASESLRDELRAGDSCPTIPCKSIDGSQSCVCHKKCVRSQYECWCAD